MGYVADKLFKMSNLSTTDKTLDIAPCGDIREGVPSQGAPSRGAYPEVLESSNEESSSEEGEIREDPKPRKRIHSPDEQSAAKRIKGPGPDAFKFSGIFHVKNRLNCIISVNDLRPFGSLEETTKGWRIRMFMDPGRHGSPTITLGFSYNGGTEQWRSTWDVDSYVQGEWAMDELTFTRISDRDPLQFSHNDYQAIMACGAGKASLISMKFRSWTRSLSILPIQKQFPKSSRPSMKAMFCPEESYMLTIWFVAPDNVVNFQQNCLGVYTRALAARRPPLYRFKDDDGVEFPAWMASRGKKLEAFGEEEQVVAPESSPAIDTEKEKGALEESVSLGDKMEAEYIRQHPHLGLRALQPTSKDGPGLTNDLLPLPNPSPLQAESGRASVETGSKAGPEMSGARSDISPHQTIESDTGLHPDVPLEFSGLGDPNVMGQSRTPTGTSPRVDPFPEAPSSPKNGPGSLMAYHGSEAAPLDIEIRPKESANPDDQTELTLTAERSSLPSAPGETNDASSFSISREDSAPTPREYDRAVPSFLFGAFPVDDESEDDSGDGSEG